MTTLAKARGHVRSDWNHALQSIAVAALALFALFWRDTAQIFDIWWNISTYNHCLLLIPILIWLVMQRKDELAQLTPVAWWPGLLWSALAAIFWLIGAAFDINLARHLALVMMLQGVVVALTGPMVSRGLAFPLFFAFFLVPFGDELIYPLQVLTADMSMTMLGWSGIPAHIAGLYISTPAGLFHVAEACSGVKFLIAMLALGALGWWWWRRREADRGDRRRDRDHEIFLLHPAGGDGGDSVPPPPEVKEPVAPPPQTPPAPTPFEAAPDTRALIEVTLVPKRAGTNVLSAAVDYTIVVQNAGDSAATGIRLDVRLLSAGTQQDAQIAAVFAAPIAQPITAPFDLPPGATVELGGMAMQPKQTLEPLDVAGKVLFVPVLTVNLTYDWVGGSGQTARSYVIGIDRGATAKLQPFRLDAPPRMYDTVAALPYPIAETR